MPLPAIRRPRILTQGLASAPEVVHAVRPSEQRATEVPVFATAPVVKCSQGSPLTKAEAEQLISQSQLNLETEIRKASLSTICWVVLIVFQPVERVGRLVWVGTALLLFIPFSLSILGMGFTSLSAVGRSISTTLWDIAVGHGTAGHS